jgi:hypothetical protein
MDTHHTDLHSSEDFEFEIHDLKTQYSDPCDDINDIATLYIKKRDLCENQKTTPTDHLKI